MSEKYFLYTGQAVVRLLIFMGLLKVAAARAVAVPLPSWFYPSLLWSGSYHEDGELLNRGDAKFRLKFTPNLDFTVRAQAFDERPSDDVLSEGLSFADAGLGVYHNPTGSRVLYGPLDVGGLPARVKNIYRHGAPFVLNHSRLSVDLKTDPGAASTSAFAARLTAPPLGTFLGGWQPFALFIGEPEDKRRSFSFGVNTAGTGKIQASAEGYYQGAVLPEKNSTGWFSDKQPLPDRDERLYAGSVQFLSPVVSAATDVAYSEVFAFGRGMYWNAGLQLGSRPWRFSAAADAVTPRFVDGAGAIPGQGLRVGGKIERFLPRGEVWRVETTLRGYGDGEDAFTRSSSAISYHFPSINNNTNNNTKNNNAKTTASRTLNRMVSLSQISVSASRNAVNTTKILDSWDVSVSLNLGNARFKTSGALDEYTHDDTPSPFPDRECTYVISSWRLDEEVVVPFDLFTLTAAAGYLKKLDTVTAQWKVAEIPLSLSAQFHAVPGRFTVKLACPDFPEGWKLSVSWRLSYQKTGRI